MVRFRKTPMQCEKDVGMGLSQYVDLCFHALSQPCLHTFWHAFPTSFYILMFFKSCFCTFLMLISVTVRPKPKKNISIVTTTPELETALTVIVVVPGM